MVARISSNRDLARQLGVSESAVRKAERAGRIRRDAGGDWNLEQVRSQWQGATDPAKQRPSEPGPSEQPDSPVAASPLRPVSEAAMGAVRETLREHGEPVSAAGGMTFLQAKTANEVLKAQTNRIRLMRLKEQLIDRARTLAHVFRLAREARDAWLNWPARVSAMIAAELGVDPVRLHTVLESHVHKHLEDLGQPDLSSLR